MYKLFACWISFFIVGIGDVSLSRADDTGQGDEAASLVSGYVANFEAIDSYDVLYKMESQFVADNGYVEEMISTERLMVDHSENSCCSIVDRSYSKLEGTDQGAVENRQVAMSGLTFNQGEGWNRPIPLPPSKMGFKQIEEVLAHNSSPIISAVGMFKFPVSYEEMRGFQETVDATRYGSIRYKLIKQQDNLEAVEYAVEGVAITRRTTVFDVSTMTPVRFSEVLELADGRVVPVVKESYRFIERNGIFLPVEITGEKRERRTIEGKDGDSNSVPGLEVYDVRFRWFSTNKSPDAKYFSGQLLKDLAEMRKLVDPRLFEEVEKKPAQ
jgi:hypothetical protein